MLQSVLFINTTHCSLCFTRTVLYLFIHEDIDDWVVAGGSFGEKSRDGCHTRVDVDVGTCGDHNREGGIRCPAHHEGHDHHHHHSCHLTLRLPDITQPAMGHLVVDSKHSHEDVLQCILIC